jgi:hypothetical protein
LVTSRRATHASTQHPISLDAALPGNGFMPSARVRSRPAVRASMLSIVFLQLELHKPRAHGRRALKSGQVVASPRGGGPATRASSSIVSKAVTGPTAGL